MARKLLIATAVLLLAAGAALFAWWSTAPEVHIDIEPTQLQQRLDAKFPLKKCPLVVACIEITRATLALADGSDRIGMKADLVVSVGSKSAPGTVDLSGKPRYVPADGAFFLDEIAIDNLQLTGFPREYAEMVKLHGPTVMRAALQAQPIYTLDTNSTKMKLAAYALRKVEIVGGKLRVTLKKPGGSAATAASTVNNIVHLIASTCHQVDKMRCAFQAPSPARPSSNEARSPGATHPRGAQSRGLGGCERGRGCGDVAGDAHAHRAG